MSGQSFSKRAARGSPPPSGAAAEPPSNGVSDAGGALRRWVFQLHDHVGQRREKEGKGEMYRDNTRCPRDRGYWSAQLLLSPRSSVSAARSNGAQLLLGGL